jgi:hypothetical protein
MCKFSIPPLVYVDFFVRRSTIYRAPKIIRKNKLLDHLPKTTSTKANWRCAHSSPSVSRAEKTILVELVVVNI